MSERLKIFFETVKPRLDGVKTEDIIKFFGREALFALPFFGNIIRDGIDEFSPDEQKELLKELKDLSESQFKEISENVGVSIGILEDIQKLTVNTFNELREDHEEIKKLLLHLTVHGKSWLYVEGTRSSIDPTAIFGRRQELVKIDELFKHKSALTITGFGGTGKTTLASMYIDTLEKREEFAGIYWRKVDEKIDINDVVGSFFTVIGKPIKEIGRYKVTDLLNMFYRELNAVPYFLVLDNFEILLDPQTNKPLKPGFSDLIETVTEGVGRSKVLITSRERPASERGISPRYYSIGGLDDSSAIQFLKHLFEKGGLTEQSVDELKKAVELSGGNPFALKLLVQLVEEEVYTLSNILTDNTLWIGEEGEVVMNILDKVYKERLNEEERKLLQYASLYREPVPLKAIVAASDDSGWTEKVVKKTALSLIRKSLLEKTGENHWLHPLVIEYVYKYLENKEKAHECAAEYYCSLNEKTHENILETGYHMIEAYGSINDKFIKYLQSITKDLNPVTCLAVLDILRNNEITSPNIFELLNEFTSSNDLGVKELFINEYGSFFEKIWQIDNKKSIEILRQFLSGAESSLLIMLSSALAKITSLFSNNEDFQDEACGLWKDIINKGNTTVLVYVSWHIIDDTDDSSLDPLKKRRILEYLIEKGGDSKDFVDAKNWLNSQGFLELEEKITCEDHLEKLKRMPIKDKLEYLMELSKDPHTYGHFIIEILNNIYEQDCDQVAKFLKLLIKRYSFNWNEIPGNDDQKLMIYLNEKCNIKWVKTAKIEKSYDGNTISVYTQYKSLSFRLNDEKTNVNLKIDDGRTDKFDVKTENGKLNIYNKSYYKYQTIIQRIPRLLAKMAEVDTKYLKIFLDGNENDVYIKYVGIRALDLVKKEIGPEKTLSILEPLKEETQDPVIIQLALIMEEEIRRSSEPVHPESKWKRFDPKRLFQISTGISRLKSELSVDDDKYLFFLMSCWGLLKSIEQSDPKLVLNILKPFNKCSDKSLIELYRLIMNTTQTSPSTMLKLANSAFKYGSKDMGPGSVEGEETFGESYNILEEKMQGIQQKLSSLWIICNVGNLDSKTAIDSLERLIKNKNKFYSYVIIFLLGCLMDIKLPEDTKKKFYEELSTHKNGDVTGFARLLLTDEVKL